MSRSLSTVRRACAALFFVLVITAGFSFVYDHSPCHSVLSVAAQASPASANTTVTNSLAVTPVTISLGSTLQATGKVTAGQKPLANTSVALHMGDVKLAYAQTNANGDYSFAVPVGVYYFPAAFSNGAAIYTVVEPHDASLISTPSAVTAVSVDLLPLFLIIAVITGVILIGLYLYTRRMHGKAVLGPLGKRRVKPAAEQTAKAHAESPPQEAPELTPTLPADGAARLVDETPQDVMTQPLEPEPTPPESVAETGVLKQAHDFFERGNDRQAVNMLYDSALIALVTTHEITIASHATHWEKYHAIEAAVPDVQAPLRALTVVYELANYAGKGLTEEQRNAAVDAFRAIKVHVESVKETA